MKSPCILTIAAIYIACVSMVQVLFWLLLVDSEVGTDAALTHLIEEETEAQRD
jgi:hypothetical protein